ncbi:SEL1-like repeat protein [Methylobacterium isbiliense]|jgi:localization factor PodJL|uniref:Localization factor PodJL n=1 Tax=Methylobacterium isbiliense TaxID=315478 RepID=A0ABQ4SEF8_9HYPH|nr:hypothetical protein [Methylobacterium isbiliense]GJE00308.1 hypothetical protein GMJLKIPL_2229 [Methylobacterium isbiliense]
MRRNAPPSFDAFDPDVREAAREAARRAGLSLDEWLAVAISRDTSRGVARPPVEREAERPPSRRSAKRWPGRSSGEREAPRPAEPMRGRDATEARPEAAPGLAAAFAAMTQRLDEIDRRLDASAASAHRSVERVVGDIEGRVLTLLRDRTGETDPRRLESLVASELDRRLSENRESIDQAIVRAVEGIEGRLSEALRAARGADGSAGLQAMLAEFEQRIAALGERIAASGQRPIGRRGLPVQDELRAAVAEIRQRQQQLDDGEEDAVDLVTAMRRDLARVADSTEAAAETLSPAIANLQAETSRLRESVTGLATGRDLGALEQAVRTMTAEVQRARQPEDLAAIVGPIDLMRVQVARLADDVAANVHARVTQDVERLARRVDGALNASDVNSLANRDAISNLFREIDAIRRHVAALAEPERIQSLARTVEELSLQIAASRGGAGEEGPVVAELRPLLEEIRSGLRAPVETASPDLTRSIAGLDRKIDELRAQTAARELPEAATDDILGRIDALSAKVDTMAAAGPVGDVIERLEQIGDSLRSPALPGGDLASIHGMLRGLAEKLDRVGQGAGSDALDGLEKQVLALAKRIDTRGSDPALAGLERTMGDLLAQVAMLRDEAPIQAAVERAARHAVADTIGSGLPSGTGPGADQLGSLHATLADLKAQQDASERRMQATMEGVHTALERLVARLSQMEGERARSDEAGPEMPQRRREPRPAAPAQAAPLRPSEEMLEPGAIRPRVPRPAPAPAVDAAPELPAGDIKANFIAAARRAAQAAAAEAAAGGPGSEAPRSGGPGAVPAAAPGLVGQLRATLERRRRPLLLGLAAIVLALGTLQAVNGLFGGSEPPASVPTVAQAPIVSPPAKPIDPPTTQALAEPAAKPLPPAPPPAAAPSGAAPPAVSPPSAEKPGADKPAAERTSIVPRIAGAALGGDLAGLPASFAPLRQAALEGDGAALYEIASRAGDGRGMTRDLALSAKLFERLSNAGYAPAQYRLGSQYEKGMGVTRDAGQARVWYGRAADQGHVRAMHNLAVMLAESGAAGGKPDYAAAAQWFRRAAEFGIRDSQYNLAVLLARGLGASQDLVQSYGWFAAAAAQGDEDAGRKRDEVAGKLSPKDLAAAKAGAEAWKPKSADPAVNEPPPPRPESTAQAAGPMSLIGAPPPAGAQRRPEPARSAAKPAGTGV